jgi:hypothetical protein
MNYMEYPKGNRWIEAPKPRIKAIQRRFSELLAQIETPEYLHSAVRKRSYVTNASLHTAAHQTVKIDIKKFYMSSRSGQVYSFLVNKLEWSGDVAGMMVKLLTIQGHLPTGGNASPLLSFWIYKDLFDAIDQLSSVNGAIFSLYVDDMTITGEFASRSAIGKVRKLIGDSQLRAHKIKYFPRGAPKVITGVAQTVSGRRLPLARQLLIRQAQEKLRNAEDNDERFEALKPLVGRLCEAAEIDPETWLKRRNRAIGVKQTIERERMKNPPADAAPVEIKEPALEELTAPWE